MSSRRGKQPGVDASLPEQLAQVFGPRRAGEPLAVSWWFTVVLVAYGVFLFYGLASAAMSDAMRGPILSVLSDSPRFGTLSVGYAVVGTAFTLVYRLEGPRLWRGIPTAYLVALGAPVIHLVAYYWMPVSLWDPLSTAAAVQAFVLTLLVATFGRRMLPPDLPSQRSRRRDALDHHMQNWWEVVRFTASVLVAFAVGIAATALLRGAGSAGVTNRQFVILALTTAPGVLCLWAFVVAKVGAVSAERR